MVHGLFKWSDGDCLWLQISLLALSYIIQRLLLGLSSQSVSDQLKTFVIVLIGVE